MPGLLRYTHPGEKPIRTGADRKHTEIQIARFLDWDLHRVREALAELSDIETGAVEKEALEQIPSQKAARSFRQAVVAAAPTRSSSATSRLAT